MIELTRREAIREAFVCFDQEWEEHRPENECRECGCTDSDCLGCMIRTGQPCFWIEEHLCSACVPPERRHAAVLELEAFSF